ncbi:MAG: MFS transporter, partial [Bryobacteraceae bacterium]
MCVLLFLATTLNYLDRQTLSILAPVIQEQMKLDNDDLGELFSVFYFAYTFSQFGVGVLLDRFNLRTLYALAVVAWSAACALTGLANGFAALMVFRLLLGVAESANWPAAMRVVSRTMPPEDRPLGNGIFTSGASIGAVIAPFVIVAINNQFGWRWTFAAVGSIGALWFAAWMYFTRSPQLAGVWQAAPEASRASGYGEILRDPQFWRVFAVTIVINPCLYFQTNWLPLYFGQKWGIEAGPPIVAKLTLIYIGLDLGNLACGAVAKWLASRGWSIRAARRAVFLAATALMSTTALAPHLASVEAAVAALVVVNFAIGVWISMYLTMAQEVSPARVSTAAGLLGGSGSLAGAAAMKAVGWVTQRTSSYTIPLTGVAVA